MSVEKCPQCGQPQASPMWRLCFCGYDFGPGASPEKPEPRRPQNTERSLKSLLSELRRIAFTFFFLASALFWGAIATRSLVTHRQFIANAVKTTGAVVELQETQSARRSVMYTPIFSFRDAAGREHIVKSNASRNWHSYKVGDAVTVLYHPNRPLNAQIDDFLSGWSLPFFMGITALFHAVAGLALCFGQRLVTRFRRGSPSVAGA